MPSSRPVNHRYRSQKRRINLLGCSFKYTKALSLVIRLSIQQNLHFNLYMSNIRENCYGNIWDGSPENGQQTKRL